MLKLWDKKFNPRVVFEYGITGNKKKLLRINDMLLPHGYYSISKASLFLQLKYFLTTSKKKLVSLT